MSGYENNTGLGGVHNHYGARDTGYAIGQETRDNSEVRLRVDLTGKSLADTFLPPVVIPKGAKFFRAVLVVDEAFDVTGVAPVVNIGEDGLEATNGVGIDATNLETVGTYDVTTDLAGEWAPASFLADSVFVGIATVDAVFANQGKASVIFEFLDLAKA